MYSFFPETRFFKCCWGDPRRAESGAIMRYIGSSLSLWNEAPGHTNIRLLAALGLSLAGPGGELLDGRERKISRASLKRLRVDFNEGPVHVVRARRKIRHVLRLSFRARGRRAPPLRVIPIYSTILSRLVCLRSLAARAGPARRLMKRPASANGRPEILKIPRAPAFCMS